jgi:predicted Zn-dependent protease
LYDDEGVKAQRASLVENGILKNFLMSRSPINNFPKSNGHGRAQAGRAPVGRQGVLVMESTQKVSWENLKQLLIEECKKQGKPYGLIFDNINGGMTNTRRGGWQAFSVIPVLVYRVYADGRPDELVRGVDLIGTPLTTFSKIIACGDKPSIFNGYCGAESGSIPASCISLPILTSQIEVQKTAKSSDKPPVLPPPDRREK